VIKKIILGISFSIVSLFLIIYVLLERTTPQLTGTIKVPYIVSDVQVLRDKYGIPHITASNKHDLYFTFGHLMASERLFQMDIYRRLATGRLSEVLGKSTLKIDKIFRTLSLKKHAANQLKSKTFSKKMLEDHKSFLQGVNHFITNGKHPIEFKLLGYAPDKFDIADGLSFIGYMAYSFSPSLKQDLLFSKLIKKVKPQLVNDLRITPNKNFKNMIALNNGAIDKIFTVFDQLVSGLSAFEGSNAWALAPNRSKSNKAILASDPHISFSLPGIWFEASLHLKNSDQKIYGHYLPGLPFAVLGHNQHLGWGLTMSYIDDMDFYKEKIDHKNNKVFYKGKWVNLERELEVIKIKGEDSYQFPLITTPHGPLLNEVIDENDISIKWSYLNKNNKAAEGFYKMNHAQTITEFEEAVSMGSSPGLNIIYADNVGNIALWMHGEIPQRHKSISGDFLLDGSNPLHEHLSPLSFDQKPKIINPKSGVIVSANSFPPEVTTRTEGAFQPLDRFQSISSYLKKQDKWSMSELINVQTSSVNINLEKRVSILLSNLNLEHLSKIEKDAVNVLKKWNYKHPIESIAATIYYSWQKNIISLILDELTSKDRDQFCKLTAYGHFFDRMLKSPHNLWWDLQKSKVKETFKDINLIAFKKTLKSLQDQFGSSLNDWTWGKLHTLEFVHPLGRKRPLDLIFNISSTPVPGSISAINNLRRVGCKDGFQVKAGPSTRRLIDFKNPLVSLGILPLGNSGHYLSPFFKDQKDLFISGKYRKQYLDLKSVKKEKHYVLNYKPN